MIKNYMKIMLRTMLKYKSYGLINITGLGVGIACALFILLWVQDELSYDRYHKNADRIYRLVDVRQSHDQVDRYPSSPFGLTPLLQVEFKEQIMAVAFPRFICEKRIDIDETTGIIRGNRYPFDAC